MDESRRDFITRGATLAAGTLLAGQARADEAQTGRPAPQKLEATRDLRLATFAPAGGSPRVGAVLDDGRVVDVGAEAQRQGVSLGFAADSMRSLIAAGPGALEAVRALLANAKGEYPAYGDLRLFAPIPDPPRNVYAVGWNYLAHFKEGEAMREDKNAKYPEHPVFFSKASHCVNGPFDAIPFDPQVSSMIDWEGELAVVIGKRGRNIPEAQALDYVFGFSVINDTTARDLQQKKHGGQWFKGKSLDGHGPWGPWIVTRGQLDYGKLHLVTRVNGVVKQDANTAQMFFKVPRIIAELSAGLTLEPGDLIATGTPPGIGAARNPPEFMKPGDVMETEIAGIGMLRNVIAKV